MSKEPEKDNLNPGSKEAVDKGCKCPVMDNHNGKGVLNGNFWINKECPIHGEPEKKDVWAEFEDVWADRADPTPNRKRRIVDFIKTHFVPRAEVVEKCCTTCKKMLS